MVAENSTLGADTLVQLIVAIARSGVLVATVQGLFTRRKTRAEVNNTGATATNMITDAAAVIVGNLQADNSTLRTELAALRAELNTLETWRDQIEQLLDAHEEWDRKVAAAINKCTDDHAWPGIPHAGPAPPLRPAQRI